MYGLVHTNPIGAMAEWLCCGLQIRLGRFDSGLRLQNLQVLPPSHSIWSIDAPASSDSQQKYWLHRAGALTAGLRQLGHVDLRVVAEHPDTLTPAEAWMLQRPEASPIWVREIVMAIDGTDCVFARSFTPLPASLGLWQGMRKLQTRPLADMLYNDPDITRSRFYTCRLTPTEPIYDSALQAFGTACPDAPDLLTRCSVFWRSNEPLLVAECFLPHFWNIAKTDI